MAGKSNALITEEQAKIEAKKRQESFRNKVRDLWENNMGLITETLRELEPKERMDVLLRLLPYGFSKMPEEKVVNKPEQPPVNVEVVRETYRQKLDQ